MQSQSNEFRPQATERLFLAVVNQAISDVLENGKEAKEAEQWLLSKDFDALDRLFAGPASLEFCNLRAISPIPQRVEGFFAWVHPERGRQKSFPAKWRDVSSENVLKGNRGFLLVPKRCESRSALPDGVPTVACQSRPDRR